MTSANVGIPRGAVLGPDWEADVIPFPGQLGAAAWNAATLELGARERAVAAIAAWLAGGTSPQRLTNYHQSDK